MIRPANISSSDPLAERRGSPSRVVAPDNRYLALTVHFSTFNVHQLSPGSPCNIDPQLRPWSRLACLLEPVRLPFPSASRSQRLHSRTCRDVHLRMLDTRCFQSNLRDLAISCPLDQFELHEKKRVKVQRGRRKHVSLSSHVYVGVNMRVPRERVNCILAGMMLRPHLQYGIRASRVFSVSEHHEALAERCAYRSAQPLPLE